MFMKRAFDIAVSVIAAIVLAVPMIVVALAVRLTSKGPVLYWSKRVGRDNHLFSMPKFRTMRIDTPVVATHLLTDRQNTSRRLAAFCGNPASTSCRNCGAS